MSSTPTTDPAAIFALRRPCRNCPFRTDHAPFISAERAQEIANDLHRGDIFYCHKTIDYTTDQEPDLGAARRCAGAAAVLRNEGSAPCQSEQIATRLGLAISELDDDQPVYDSLDEWVDAHNLSARIGQPPALHWDDGDVPQRPTRGH